MLKTLYLFNRLTGISTGQEDEIMLKKDKSEALTKEYTSIIQADIPIFVFRWMLQSTDYLLRSQTEHI